VAILIGYTPASAVAARFARYLALFVPLDKTLLAAGLIVMMTFVSFWGIKESARFNAVATSIEVGGLLLLIVVGGYFIITGHTPLAKLTELPPLASPDASAWLPVVSAGALIFFAYMGFEDIANIAEEAQNPSQTLPRAFMYALLISSVIYVLVAIVAVSVVPFSELAASDQPLSLIMGRLVGGGAAKMIAVIALFATANTVLITLIVCARMMYGMARSSSLPAPLARVHKWRKTPYVAAILVGLLSIGFFFFKDIEILASISDVGIFLLFLAVNLSNIILRYRQADAKRPWRGALNIGRMPLLSLLGAVSCVLMLFSINHPVQIGDIQFSSLLLGLAIFAAAIPLYFVLDRSA